MKSDAGGTICFPIVDQARIGARGSARFKAYEASGLTVQVAQSVTQNVFLEVR